MLFFNSTRNTLTEESAPTTFTHIFYFYIDTGPPFLVFLLPAFAALTRSYYTDTGQAGLAAWLYLLAHNILSFILN